MTIKDLHMAHDIYPITNLRARPSPAIKSLTECYDNLLSRIDGSGSFRGGRIGWLGKVEPMVTLCFSAVDIIRIVEIGAKLNKAVSEIFNRWYSDNS